MDLSCLKFLFSELLVISLLLFCCWFLLFSENTIYDLSVHNKRSPYIDAGSIPSAPWFLRSQGWQGAISLQLFSSVCLEAMQMFMFPFPVKMGLSASVMDWFIHSAKLVSWGRTHGLWAMMLLLAVACST